MTRDEIIEMLRASCDKDKVDPEQNGFWVIVTEELVRFANSVAQHEREACAELCEMLDVANPKGKSWDEGTIDCANVIRARGQA